MRFDWTDLQIFLHVCEAGSMTGAAARCHLTLAAVSARIRSLEDSSGIVLLERQARGVTPTPAGEVLAAHARVVFDQLQQLERDLLHRRSGTAPQTVLLANSAALARPLADALVAPEQGAVLVRESASEATVQALLSGAADVGIVSDAVVTRGLVAMDLGPDPLVAVVAQAHPLAARSSVRFDEVLEQPWIAWGEQSALSTHLQLRAVASGHRIQARITYPRLDGVLRLVARGLGVTILPQALVASHAAASAIACLPLEDAWANRRLLVCHLEGDEPARRQLADGIGRLWLAFGRS
ncbi:MAG TPA: LysR family transcriptional regulator [Ramlibacter sp.]|uniref:LysR family transcriptional regulator n=1 Tax=Ramlibacter sp. TaxID=1917967 RepID=UPI002ED46DB9